MDLKEINELTRDLDDKSRLAILELINLKTEDDMEKILTKMENMFLQTNTKMDAKFSQIESHMGSKFAQIESHVGSKFAHVEGSISTIRWVIGVAAGVLTLVLTIMAFKIH